MIARTLAALAAVVGCSSPNGGTRAEPPAPTEPTSETMRDHFDAVDAIKAALVEGDLATAQGEAARVVNAPLDPGLAPWEVHADKMRSIARELQRSANVEGAALAAARLGAVCGECHEALGHRPELKPTPEPADGDIHARMQLHAWASDRMWQGLLIPSDNEWQRGALAIARAPLVDDRADAAVLVALQSRADAVAAIAARSLGARGPERASLFGALLGTCGGCHRLVAPQ